MCSWTVALIKNPQAQLFKSYYHTHIECAGSLTCIRPFCYLQDQWNREQTMNTGCILLRPLMKFYVSDSDVDAILVHFSALQVQQVTKERYGPFGDYRPIMSYPPYEWCKVMLDSAVNPIYKLVVQAVANSAPELFHICPYWVINFRWGLFKVMVTLSEA